MRLRETHLFDIPSRCDTRGTDPLSYAVFIPGNQLSDDSGPKLMAKLIPTIVAPQSYTMFL